MIRASLIRYGAAVIFKSSDEVVWFGGSCFNSTCLVRTVYYVEGPAMSGPHFTPGMVVYHRTAQIIFRK